MLPILYYFPAEISCGFPGSVANAVVVEHNGYIFGSMVGYHCLQNHRFKDGITNKSVICEGMGQWTSLDSTCEGV